MNSFSGLQVRPMNRLTTAVLFLAIAPQLLAAEVEQKSWPRWRGPQDVGSTAKGAYWAEFSPDSGLAWKAELPGRGCSTPAVLGEQILLTCPIDGADAVVSYDWKGVPQWQAKIGPEKPGKHRNGSAANSSPATDGKYLFAYFRSGNLAGLNLAGDVLWKTNLQERFGKDTLYWDIGTSPVITDNACVVAVMHSGESYLVAFEKASGDILWKVARNYETPVEGDHSYATPIVIKDKGKQAILVWGAERLTAHDAKDGSILWTCAGFNPKKQGNWVAVASAIVVGDMTIVPYGRGSHLVGVKLGGSGDVTETHRLWTREDTGTFVPSPVAYDGKLYLVRDGGEVECLDPATGNTLWSDRFPKSSKKFYSSPTIAGGRLYAAREDGVVMVADVKDGFKFLAENNMQEQIIASPVPIDGHLLIRGEKHLFCVGK
jgi:outer membrane protein assembly factor BamB